MNEFVPVGSIHRAKVVLDTLAGLPNGASLSQVIAGTEFTRTTAHRTLQSLQAVQYVYQDPETRKYHLGAALARMSRTASLGHVTALSMRAMCRLADETEDTIFLSIPEGPVSVCAHVQQGAFPIRTLTLKAGDRVPVGVGATGQALYAAMPRQARVAAAEANTAWMADYNYTPEMAEALAADFDRRGHALNPSIPVPGMSAVAMPILSDAGTLVAAIGIGAINERMTAARIETTLLPPLSIETAGLSRKFSLLEAEGLL